MKCVWLYDYDTQLHTVFLVYNGVVHHEFLPQGRTVNKEYNLEVMRRLRQPIRQKRTELWKKQSWILHHDNGAFPRGLCVSFWPKTKPQVPCSPKLKTPMKGKRFATIEEIKSKSKQELLAIPKRSFQKCFEDWKKRLHMSGYFEGDKIVIDKLMNTLWKNFK